MERTITAILTNSNDKKVFTSNANTLGELKAEMTAQGIDYHGMDFMEGLTHTTMIDDASILPSNVQYKGRTTNNLVFMLSTTNKQIRSGADRTHLYDQIKKYNLQEVIKREEGKNYTQCNSEVLMHYIAKKLQSIAKVVPSDRKSAYEFIKKHDDLKGIISSKYDNYTRVDTATLIEECKNFVCNNQSCKKETPKKKEVESPYSAKELETIMHSLGY